MPASRNNPSFKTKHSRFADLVAPIFFANGALGPNAGSLSAKRNGHFRSTVQSIAAQT